MRRRALITAVALVLSGTVAGCTTPAGPVQVTRFVADNPLQQLGTGTIFVEAIDEDSAPTETLLTYQAAVARELTALGYRETARDQASQIAQVRVARERFRGDGGRGPVTVGGGVSTGTYGTGGGVGIGINLGGGGKSGEQLATRLEVRINDAASGTSLWEGRALFDVASKSVLADSAQNASVMADALFRSFPGNSGETVEVDVTP